MKSKLIALILMDNRTLHLITAIITIIIIDLRGFPSIVWTKCYSDGRLASIEETGSKATVAEPHPNEY